MRRVLRGRITTEPERDVVTLEVRLSGLLFRTLLGTANLISNTLMLGVVFFGIAGTLEWRRAWVFIGVWSGSTFLLCVLSTTEVLLERMWPFHDLRGLERGDLAFIAVLFPSAIAYLVVMPLEVFHLDLLDPPPLWVAIGGLGLVVVGWAFMILSTRENRFASPIVKLQEARHQTVVDTGVYGIVRHPMYLGAAMLAIGLPLWLGSYLGLIIGAGAVVALALRIRVEERVLRHGLPGYTEYTQRVRHRLFPHVW